MDKTFKWFTVADLRKYEDKYVSIVDQRVVCADVDFGVALKKAKKKYPNKEEVLWKVLCGDSFIGGGFNV